MDSMSDWVVTWRHQLVEITLNPEAPCNSSLSVQRIRFCTSCDGGGRCTSITCAGVYGATKHQRLMLCMVTVVNPLGNSLFPVSHLCVARVARIGALFASGGCTPILCADEILPHAAQARRCRSSGVLCNWQVLLHLQVLLFLWSLLSTRN